MHSYSRDPVTLMSLDSTPPPPKSRKALNYLLQFFREAGEGLRRLLVYTPHTHTLNTHQHTQTLWLAAVDERRHLLFTLEAKWPLLADTFL